MRPLVSERIARIAPYVPGKPIEELERELGSTWPKEGAIKLASNENPLGPSPKALEAAQAVMPQVNQYPDGDSYYLRQALARKCDVRADQIAIGQGSNDLIDLLVQAFTEPDEEVLAPKYAFLCYKLSADAHRRPFREAPVGPGFSVDADDLLAQVGPRTKILFLANPNNPTGQYLSRAGFEHVVDKLPADVILAVDEAYFEYVRAADYPNALHY